MHQPPRPRAVRSVAVIALVAGLLLPSAAPAVAADPVVLKVGTTQGVEALNPFNAVLVDDYEAFILNYDLLVGYGPNLEPAPGFASSWTQDGTTWTFKIPAGSRTWSDGTPATAEDARWTLQTLLDGQKKDGYVGSGYIDPYLSYAGVTAISAPDPETLVVETETPNTQMLTAYIPIVPKHIWKDRAMGADPNAVPVIGSGPYQAVEWKTGEYVRFERNPNYWGKQGYADVVYLQKFGQEDTMIQALKQGEIDYARGISAPQFDALKGQDNIVTVKATANGFTELGFNAYSKDIPGGGASTTATRDPAFRDAVAYAVDKPALIDAILSGYGTPGTAMVPPFQSRWYAEPQGLRTFDIELAKQKLAAAGYLLDSGGNRLDKEGKPLNLTLVVPDSSDTYSTAAQFIRDWWAQLGINVETQQYDSDTLTNLMLPPEGDPPGKAKFDLFIWDWVGDVDPNSLLNILATSAIGSSSDSLWSNARYDELYKLQGSAPTDAERKGYMAEMQQLVYDEAPYIVLFYDDSLHAYRTDTFGGWQTQPLENGTPFFGFGPIGYVSLTAPAPEATPTPVVTQAPAASGAALEPTPTAAPTPASGGDSTLLVGGAVVALIVIGMIALVLVRRRKADSDEEA
jgi:peptide/nickel transport system substrate-binding protein